MTFRQHFITMTDDFLVLEDVLSVDECVKWKSDAEAAPILPELAISNDFQTAVSVEIGGLFNSIDDQEQADIVFARIKHKLLDFSVANGSKASGINENFRILKYLRGEDFPVHRDPDYHRPHGHENFGDVSLLTLIIYLNDDFTGGDTVFYSENSNSTEKTKDFDDSYNKQSGLTHGEEIFRVHPKQGTAVLFRHHTPHAGEMIETGCKYILRTDVMFCKL